MNSILITGCNRGLGLGLVKVLVGLPAPQPTHIIATYRDAQKSQDLLELAKQHSNIVPMQFDVKNFERYDQFAKDVDALLQGAGLNVLFNNAGISPKSTRLNFTKQDDLVDTFVTNTVAPIMMTKAFVPLLKKASDSNPTGPVGPQRACIVNMSSILGSIEANREGGLYGYRTSKAALNAATKSMSLDLKGHQIMAVALHPGWVQTDMGGSKAPLTVEESCKAMVNTVLALNESNNGGFLQYDGTPLPW
ncbi:C-factor [Anopheles funestus]|uniref:Short-chain dehydrogenase n=1 Tax=Anopheles funestus TaxID=62324 RepID=A0A182RV38_ANOFN|nr:C-factor [Anopheles funestus]